MLVFLSLSEILGVLAVFQFLLGIFVEAINIPCGILFFLKKLGIILIFGGV
jgi:hypothetical protein